MSPDANAVRTPGGRPDVLVAFPEDRILRARTFGDQVAVTHRGETTIYESPQAMAGAVREYDPVARSFMDQLGENLAAAREASAAADGAKAAALRLYDEARKVDAAARDRLIRATAVEVALRARIRGHRIAIAIGCGLALLACGFGL